MALRRLAGWRSVHLRRGRQPALRRELQLHLGRGEPAAVHRTARPCQLGDKRLTFWYDYLGRVAFTQHEEYTNEYGYNHWGETGWDWFIYDGWNVVQEIDACWWTPKAQYSWGLDLSQTLQSAGGIGGLLAMHVPADRCAAIGGGASAMNFRMPGSLAGLLEEAAAEGSGDPSAGDRKGGHF